MLRNLPDDEEPQRMVNILLAGFGGEIEPSVEYLMEVLFNDHTLTGKQQYELALRLHDIELDMDPELVNYDSEAQPHEPSDICAVLYALLVGVERFVDISAKAKDIHELNNMVMEAIVEEGSTPTADRQAGLMAYIKGCCLMNATDFFEEWMRQTFGLEEEEQDENKN